MAVHADLFGYFCLIYLDEVFIVQAGQALPYITFMSLPVKFAFEQASSLLLEPLPSILSEIRFALWNNISHKAFDYFTCLMVNLLHVPIH